MTEQEWLASSDPEAMIGWLRVMPGLQIGIPSDRKLRLFATAAFRVCGGGNWSNDSAWALRHAEEYADGQMDADQLRNLHHAISKDLVAEYLLRPRAVDSAFSIVRHYFPGPHADASGDADSLEIANLLRDIVGNPFREQWLEVDCYTTDVLAIAHEIYDERTFDELPVLADALEDAGCGNEDIIEHLRSPGPHVRGCWALDLILGKE